MEKLIKQMMDDQVSLMAELGGYTETLNLLQAKFCQFDGSEDKDERNNTVDALHTLWCSMERFGKECSVRINGYWERFAQCRVEKTETDDVCKKCRSKYFNKCLTCALPRKRRDGLEKCKGCEVQKKGWCSPLKQWQCENGYDNELFIHLLIQNNNEMYRKLMKAREIVGPDVLKTARRLYESSLDGTEADFYTPIQIGDFMAKEDQEMDALLNIYKELTPENRANLLVMAHDTRVAQESTKGRSA